MLFNGLLAELPTILDTSTTSDYIGLVGRGSVVGSHKVTEKNTRQVVTPPYGPIDAINSPKSSQISERQSEHSWTSDMPQKAALGKAD